MDINTRRLRYFLAVVDTGHFGRAAAALHLSPAALSEQVRKLEDELGVRLLERTARGAQPTSVGREVAEHARSVLSATAELCEVVEHHLRMGSQVFRLGFVTLAAGELTPHLVMAFEAGVPGLRVELTHLDYARQVTAVLSHEVDAAIVRGPLGPTELRVAELATEPRMVMMSAAHPLAGRSALRCADIAGEVRVTTSDGSQEWRSWWSLDPGPDGAAPPYGPTIRSFEEQMEHAALGTAISIVPAAAASVFRREDLAFVPLSDAEPSTILLVARSDTTGRPVEALFTAAQLVRGLRHSRT